MLWLLLTGNVPTVEETKGLSEELASKGKLPSYAEKIIDSFPKTMREFFFFFSTHTQGIRKERRC